MTRVLENYVTMIDSDDYTGGCFGCNGCCIYVPTINQKVIRKLGSEISHIESQSIMMQVLAFCDTLSKALIKAEISYSLPEMLTIAETDEFYLEWIFDYYRFGFDFLEDGSNSGWFVLIKKGDDTYRFRSRFDWDYRKAVDCAITTIKGENVQ